MAHIHFACELGAGFSHARDLEPLAQDALKRGRRVTMGLGDRVHDLPNKPTHAGPGHTGGDTIAWFGAEKVLLSGDLVAHQAGVYTGDPPCRSCRPRWKPGAHCSRGHCAGPWRGH